jgi:hypothetical protein
VLKLLKKLLGRFRRPQSPAPAEDGRSRPTKKLGDKVGNVTIMTQAQLDKWTDFKPGESYRVGEGIVTVHACKEDMWLAIMRVEDTKFIKDIIRHERAVDLMMMSPEELEKLKIDEWIAKREKAHINLKTRLKSRFWKKKLVPYEAPPKQPVKAEVASTEKVKVKV